MIYLAGVRKAIKKELEQGRLGTPVFARLVMVVSSDHGHLLPVCAMASEMIEEFLGQSIQTIFARGSIESGSISVQLHLGAIQTGQAIVTLKRGVLPGVDLLLVGDRGTLRHDLSEAILAGETHDDLWRVGTDSIKPGLVGAVEESLKIGRPVRVRG